MSFPVWRELKQKCSKREPENHWKNLQCPFPFEGNWNPFWVRCVDLFADLAYNVLSRLKGIETCHRRIIYISLHIILQCPFPFEGNWNNAVPVCVASCRFMLTMSFPVWRELKHHSLDELNGMYERLQCPFPFEGNWNESSLEEVWIGFSTLTMSFPVWRELKLLAFGTFAERISPYNVLSRLKGIETRKFIGFEVYVFHFCLQCPFPFEGNWNLRQNA